MLIRLLRTLLRKWWGNGALPQDKSLALAAPVGRSVFRLGRIAGSNRFFELDDETLSTHLTCLGRTGTGKSRMLEQLILEHVERRRAAIVLDPDGDLVENVLARVTRHVIETGSEAVLKRVHYLAPDALLAFSYDPFAFRLPKQIHPELGASVREAWLHCKVDRVADILLRKQGQQSFDGMPRLQRVLRDVLYVVGTMVEGKRLALADATLILDFGHDLNKQLWAKVEPFLPRDVASDFRVLRSMKRIEDLRRETESTLNRLRSMFGPVMRAIFSRTEGASFSLFDAIQNGHVVLVHLRPGEYGLSEDQTVALGRLLIYDAIATAMGTPREARKPCTLIVDEAAEFVTPDVGKALRRMRKYLLGVVLCAQTIESFKKDDCDLRSLVLGQPETIMTFNQRWPDDLALLSRLLFTGKLDFTEHLQEVERQGDPLFIPILEYSGSRTRGSQWNVGEGESESEADSASTTRSLAELMGWSHGDTRSLTEGTNETKTTNQVETTTLGSHQSPVLKGTQVEKMLDLTSGSKAKALGSTEGRGRTAQVQEGATDTVSGSQTASLAEQTGKTLQHGTNRSSGVGGSENETEGWSLRYAQVQTTVREWVRTGKLQQEVADQLEKFAQALFNLRKRQAAVLSGSESFFMETLEVSDAFASPEALVKAIEWASARLREIHPYLFFPDLTPDEEDRRLRAFLGLDNPEAEPPAAESEKKVPVEAPKNPYGN